MHVLCCILVQESKKLWWTAKHNLVKHASFVEVDQQIDVLYNTLQGSFHLARTTTPPFPRKVDISEITGQTSCMSSNSRMEWLAIGHGHVGSWVCTVFRVSGKQFQLAHSFAVDGQIECLTWTSSHDLVLAVNKASTCNLYSI